MLINNHRYGISKFGGYAFIGVNGMQTKGWSIFKGGHMLLAMEVTLMDLVVHI